MLFRALKIHRLNSNIARLFVFYTCYIEVRKISNIQNSPQNFNLNLKVIIQFYYLQQKLNSFLNCLGTDIYFKTLIVYVYYLNYSFSSLVNNSNSNNQIVNLNFEYSILSSVQ